MVRKVLLLLRNFYFFAPQVTENLEVPMVDTPTAAMLSGTLTLKEGDTPLKEPKTT